MKVRHISFDKIEESHLQALIDTGSSEARDIEYKRTTYAGNDDSRAEFLADISSLANTIGGDLIIGLSAKDGIPVAFEPLPTDGIEKECLRLENMARDGIEPRIANLEVKAVSLSVGGSIILIRVPRSYNPPHRVIFKNKNRFWARSSAGKYEPDIDELRSLFTLAPQLASLMRNFRSDRVAKIAGDVTPVVLSGKLRLVMHLIPFSAFDIGSVEGISLNQVSKQPNYFPTIFSRNANNWRVNFDGFLVLSNHDLETYEAYVQIFRSGIVESVAVLDYKTGPIESVHIAAGLVNHTRVYCAGLMQCGGSFPMVLLVSLLGMSNQTINGAATGYFSHQVVKLDREQLNFSEVILEECPDSNQSCATLIKNVLDQLANAADYSESPFFDAGGIFTLLK